MGRKRRNGAMRSKNGQNGSAAEVNASRNGGSASQDTKTTVTAVETLDSTELHEGGGVLELHPSGYGFLRDPAANYERRMSDPFVPGSMIEKYGLRQGVYIRGLVQPGKKGQGPRLREIHDVDGLPPQEYVNVKNFDELTPINPEEWLRLETGPEPLTTRVMDLLTPIGKGQRALIVAPPRTDKTVLL
ncbi:MAG TPA: transcription termination factor Rho, partial [Thermogutta sp.]|nr:transcription termination factor Rho [Thermogutta sp.]